MHPSTLLALALSIVLGAQATVKGEKIKRQSVYWPMSIDVEPSYSDSYAYSSSAADYSIIVPPMSGDYDYPSASAIPSVSAYPSNYASSYYPSSYASSGPQPSNAPGRPRPSRQHTGGDNNGGNNNGGINTAQSSGAPQPAGNAASSMSSLGGGLCLVLGLLSGVVAFVL